MKPKLTILCATIFVTILALGIAPAYAGGNRVAYTFTFVDIVFGIHGGGTLFADGTAIGTVTLVLANGATVAAVHPETWTAVPGGVTIEGEFRVIKGELPPLGPEPIVFPISGTPVLIDFDMDGNPDAIVRVTPAN